MACQRAFSVEAHWFHVVSDLHSMVGLRDGAHLAASCSFFRFGLKFPDQEPDCYNMLFHLVLAYDKAELNTCLLSLSRATPSFAHASVGNYCSALRALNVIPRVTVDIVNGVECFLRRARRPQYCLCRNKSWTTYAMDARLFRYFATGQAVSAFSSQGGGNMSFLNLLDTMIECATVDCPVCLACRSIPAVPDESSWEDSSEDEPDGSFG